VSEGEEHLCRSSNNLEYENESVRDDADKDVYQQQLDTARSLSDDDGGDDDPALFGRW